MGGFRVGICYIILHPTCPIWKTGVRTSRLVIPVRIAHATFSIGLKKKGSQHGRPTTGLSYRTMRATRWMACPPPQSPLLCFCFRFVERVLFLFLVAVARTMSKYISPWHLSLLCSIFALMHWQQLTAEITNVGDPRLVAKQPTTCHQLVLQLSNWRSLPHRHTEMEQAALNRMAQSIA